MPLKAATENINYGNHRRFSAVFLVRELRITPPVVVGAPGGKGVRYHWLSCRLDHGIGGAGTGILDSRIAVTR